MKLVQKYPVLGSSVNPEALSLTIKGVLGGIATVLVALGIMPIGDVSPLIEAVGTIIVQVGAVVSTVITLTGLMRKIYNGLNK